MHKPPHYGLHPPYAAVCLFRRQAGRPDNGNCLESCIGQKAKNFSPSSDILRLVYSRFVQFMGVSCNGV